MRKLLLTCLSVAFSMTAQGQYWHFPISTTGYNPNNINQEAMEYPVGGGLPTDWSTILSPQTLGTYSSWQTVPFTFEFNGQNVDSFRVSNTGILTFSKKSNPASHAAATRVPLSSSTIPDSSICVLGINGSGSSDNVVTKTFGTAPNRQEWITFSSYSLTGSTGSHWTYWSIVLEETTNNIYIVDQKVAYVTPTVNIGIRIDSNNVDEIIGVVSSANNDPTPANNTFHTFIQGIQPAYDMMAVEVNLNSHVALGSAPFTVSGEFLNFGSTSLTSAQINYSVNGGSAVSSTFSGLNLTSGNTGTITSSATWTPSTTGTYTLKVWLSNLNGSNSDGNPTNDTATLSIQVVPALATRYPLYETFTSSTCSNCPQSNATLEGVFSNNPGEYNSIKYPMDWPGAGDPYYAAEFDVRRSFYNITSISRTMIDAGFNEWGIDMTQSTFDEYQNIPCFVEMNATFSRFSKSIETTIEIDPLININSNNLRLFAAIYSEKDTANVASNGQTEFLHVVKKMMPTATGKPIPALTSGNSVTHTLSYTFNGDYRLPYNAAPQNRIDLNFEHCVEDFSTLGVIAWLQDINTNEIFQSVDATYTIGQYENSLASKIEVYPNPTTDVLFVEGDFSEEATVRLVDIAGREFVRTQADFTGGHRVEISTATLAPGTYLLITTTRGASHAQPVIVQ